jgi:hypothetical protein
MKDTIPDVQDFSPGKVKRTNRSAAAKHINNLHRQIQGTGTAMQRNPKIRRTYPLSAVMESDSVK